VSNDTIVALATAPGESAVSITRLSGPDALALAASRFRGRHSPVDSASHRILFGTLLGSDGSAVDTVLLSVFRAPRSYTGEDVVEISSHGGVAIPRAVLASLVEAGARPARPGEFTERAFRNGKLDLAQAESVAALIRARSDRASRAALEGLGGSLSRRVAELDAELVGLLAEVEARIDFPGDVGDAVDGAELGRRCGCVAASLREWIDRLPGTRRIQEGVRAALVGRANVGKSSLLNALVGYDRAIVNPAPGTTRDTVEESIWLEGVELRLADTAGARGGGAPDSVEGLGMARAARAAGSCDLAVLVLDRSDSLGEADREAASWIEGRPVVVAWNKADLRTGATSRPRAPVPAGALLAEVETVAVRPGGADPLLDALRSSLPRILRDHAGSEVATTSARQDGLLVEALDAVERARSGLEEDRSYDLIAVDLADARRALADIVGRGVDDEVAAAIFSRFCIGK
jgi:tRNA modification GTPase